MDMELVYVLLQKAIHTMWNNTAISVQMAIISRFLINLRRATLENSAPSRPSDIRTSRFRLPTIPDIVEDMGGPLSRSFNTGADPEAGQGVPNSVPVAGPSFIRGSSTSGAASLAP